MAITHRRGAYGNFNSDKMLTGEIAVVVSGDPNTDNGKAMYMCFEPGEVKRIMTYDDLVTEIKSATADILVTVYDARDRAETAAEQAEAITKTATEIYNQINELYEKYKNSDVGTLQAQVENLETKTSTLETDLDTKTTTIQSNLDAKVTTLQTNIDNRLLTSSLLDSTYPVGSIYISVIGTNPGTLFGGTWVAFAAGRTLVGIQTNDASFNVVENMGGEKTHTLTIDEIPPLSVEVEGYIKVSVPPGTNYGVQGTDNTKTEKSSSVGGGQPHNNLQPYIVVYMWKRTA